MIASRCWRGGMLGWLFGDKTEREARRLNEDARVIVEQTHQIFSEKGCNQIAERIVEYLTQARTRYGQTTVDLQRAHHDYRRLHREARRRGDQRELSALTLVIIHLRAGIAGAAAQPAQQAIEDFLGAHGHTLDV